MMFRQHANTLEDHATSRLQENSGKILIEALCCRWQRKRRTYKWLDWCQFVLPMIGWLRTYNIRENIIVRLSSSLEKVTPLM